MNRPNEISKNTKAGGRRSRLGLLAWIVFAAALSLSSTVLHADDIGDLQSKADAWISASKQVYRLDCDDMKQIWEAYCSKYDVTLEKDRDAARSIADKMKDDAQGAIQHQIEEYDHLKNEAEGLKNGDTESQAASILDAMKTEDDRLEKLKDKGAWRGANNPLIQYAIEYGKQKHNDMDSSSDYQCDVADKEISGADGRPDCISARKCTVYEFKPDNDRAKSKGEEQLARYVPAVNQYYSNQITGKETPDSDLGGSDIIKLIHENKDCYEGDWPDGGDPNGEIRTKFKGEIKTYTPCENTYECTSP